MYLFQILIRMNRLCIQPGPGGTCIKPRKHEQRLLRNVGVHTVVLDLLQIPYDKKEDVRMNELMRLAHEFLQNFCLGNQQNQSLLHKQLDLFLNPGVSLIIIICLSFVALLLTHFFKFFYFYLLADFRSSNCMQHLSR